MYDLVIIGSGPAGLSAAVYAARAQLDFVVIESNMMSGGQIMNTETVDNYLGLMGMGGFEMGMKFREHADTLGAQFISETVTGIEMLENSKLVKTLSAGEEKSYETRSVIIATGAIHRNLGVPGENELRGRGVSYCATCDGAFFRNKTVCVVGGGDVALEDALYLSKLCSKVYLIHRRDTFRAAKSLIGRAKETENIEIITPAVIKSINGDDMVTSIDVENTDNGNVQNLEVSGVFIAVGMQPLSEIVPFEVDMKEGYIVAGEDCRTNVLGIYAAGDVRTKNLRQIITAAADGACAVSSLESDMMKLN